MTTDDASESFIIAPNKISLMDNSKKMKSRALGILSRSDACHASSDAALFSSSLPVLPHEKLNLNDFEHGCQSVDDLSASEKLHQQVEISNLLEDVEDRVIGSLLPDDEDELLAGIMEGFDINGVPDRTDELEEYDLFGSGGGLELESDAMGMSNRLLSDGVVGNGVAHYGLPSGIGSVVGEHPLGEHPSRTLFVRNINSNVDDSELRTLFEQYGDIRAMYTACKHRGFVMISYYDIRSARTALRALQNKPLGRRKLDIHFSIPKDNPSDKDMNQGTLVVFNLDPSVSNDDLRQIFGAYGEVKEIRETPHKRHHKFIEYYDVRAAEAALRSLNRSDIAGKRIKLEPSRPGGARRNLVFQVNQEPELDESWSFQHHVGSPIVNSPPTGSWPQFGSPIERNTLQSLGNSPGFRSMSPTIGNNLPGLASTLHPPLSNPAKAAPIGRDHVRGVEHSFTNRNSSHGINLQQSHSLPDPKLGQYSKPMSYFGASSTNRSGIETLSGPQFLWGSPKPYPDQTDESSWQKQSTQQPFTATSQIHGFPYSNLHRSFSSSSNHHHHHVGSAPSPFRQNFDHYQESSFDSINLGQNDGNFVVNMGSRGAMGTGITMSLPRFSPMFLGNRNYGGLPLSNVEGFTDRGLIWRAENSGRIDSKKQFLLDLDKIKNGEDTRTTLMIKNIPNKYTSKMLLESIDENHRGTYDFLYLPIDFKNKCNVGYAFINMVSPTHVIPFYEEFNGKKWEKFNSEKVASLAYARIQGKTALVTHFQNSSLMNEDKRCRPIIFQLEGSDAADQEHFPIVGSNIQVRLSNRSDSRGSPPSPVNDGVDDKQENS